LGELSVGVVAVGWVLVRGGALGASVGDTVGGVVVVEFVSKSWWGASMSREVGAVGVWGE
jgi:hypothetical protein